MNSARATVAATTTATSPPLPGMSLSRRPSSRGISFEAAIIERYRRRESSVEEALIEMYLAEVFARPSSQTQFCIAWYLRTELLASFCRRSSASARPGGASPGRFRVRPPLGFAGAQGWQKYLMRSLPVSSFCFSSAWSSATGSAQNMCRRAAPDIGIGRCAQSCSQTAGSQNPVPRRTGKHRTCRCRRCCMFPGR